MAELDEMMGLALELAEGAKARALEVWMGAVDVRYKADGSSQTEADLSIEALWREEIAVRFPSHGILGEEYGVEAGQSAYTWVLDPIDGTRQFGAGLLNFTSLISVCRDGAPVLGVIDLPAAGACFAAAEGCGVEFAGARVRSSGRHDLAEAVVSVGNPESFGTRSRPGYEALRAAGRVRVYDGSSTAYGALARGLIDVCINGDDLEAFDICALVPVVQEAGGAISDWRGEALTLASEGAIAASASPELHAQVLERLAAGR